MLQRGDRGRPSLVSSRHRCKHQIEGKRFQDWRKDEDGGKVPHGDIAEKNPSSCFENPFHNLLHSHQLHNLPKSKLPTFWDMDRSDSAGKGSFGPEAEERWGDGSKDWDSPLDRIMSRIESNTEMIRNLGYKLDELKETIEKLVERTPSPPKE